MEIGPRLEALKLFVRRLQARSEISAIEHQALLGLTGQQLRIEAHRDFVHLGEAVQDSCLIVSGLVARFAQLEDGSRQIISLHIPGDMIDLYSLMLPRAPSPLQGLTNCTVMKIPHTTLRELVSQHRGLSAALWRDCVVDGAIIAQWLVNVGRRAARSRIAHMLCEMAVRYQQCGLLVQNSYPFPMTQEQMGDALGLTSVHVNRSIKTLREAGLLQLSRAGVTILDWNGLTLVAEFDPAYLNLPFDPASFGQETSVRNDAQPTIAERS